MRPPPIVREDAAPHEPPAAPDGGSASDRSSGGRRARLEFGSGIIKSMGLVFGDIGTSPIYTLTVIFALVAPTRDNVFGILSLIVWTLLILVSVEYSWLAMSLSKRGEGGTIVLRELLLRKIGKIRSLTDKRRRRETLIITYLSIVGISLLLGDGVITPAISILSAVEGLRLIPGVEGLSQHAVVAIAAVIAVGLFVFQYKGTDKVARTFGPIMVLWFVTLAVSGTLSLLDRPVVGLSISPLYAVNFLWNNKMAGFLLLSDVILCATGAEALYADMGHLGRRPIRAAWWFVLVALVLNYLGQGAYALGHPGESTMLFGMVRNQSPLLYIPFLILTVSATVIASQALISGVFSVIYQAITTRLMPLMRVHYTSSHLKSQIYIGLVNWLLMALVLFIMVIFGESGKLAAAYGLAVTGTMSITGIMLIWNFTRSNRHAWKIPLAVLVTVVDLAFLGANLHKIPAGGYWSLILAAMPFAVIVIWKRGHEKLYRQLRPYRFEETFRRPYEQLYRKGRNIPGTAIFFTREIENVPPYIGHCMFKANIIYERNILISISRTFEPYGIQFDGPRVLTSGLEAVEIRAGYMEVLGDLDALLEKRGIREKVVFYGIEDIVTANPVWKFFSLMKRSTANFVQFYQIKPSKLQGVVTRVEM